MIVKCPHCGFEEDAPEEYVGETAICDSCQGEYVVGSVVVQASAFDEQGDATIECPYCHAQNNIRIEYANRKVRCCECNGKFYIQVQMQDKNASATKHIRSNANATLVICPHCGNTTELTEESVGQLINCVCGQRFAVGVARAQAPALKNSGKQECVNNSDNSSCLMVLLKITLIPLIIFVCAATFVFGPTKMLAVVSPILPDDLKVKIQQREQDELYEKTLKWYDAQLEYNGLCEENIYNAPRHKLLSLSDGITIEMVAGNLHYPRNIPAGFAQELIEARMFINDYERAHCFQKTRVKNRIEGGLTTRPSYATSP